ncbi:MAG: aminotransferase class V-fold PLP-dependent enzyme [Clostridiales bacterium]|jgi:cysteine desulfurase|nr:aminotransferase class V-fold PLP-dependent enzyme [Clostridiales bacterium]
MIYLDYAADTPADEAVLKVFLETQREFFANPNSSHALGAAAAERLKTEIEKIKSFFEGAEDYEFIPTATASEANNLALRGIAESYKENGKHIISTYLEHPSVGGALTYLQGRGYEVELVQVKKDGKIDLEHLESLMRKDTVLVSVCAVDSELGTVQPIGEIAKIVSKYPLCRFHTDAAQAVGRLSEYKDLTHKDKDGDKDYGNGKFHTDAAQAVGRLSEYKDLTHKDKDGDKGGGKDKDVKFSLQGISCLSFAAHKFYGLNGAAFLVRHKKTVLTPLIHGGSNASLYRGGTPSLPLAASAREAIERAYSEAETRYRSVLFLNVFLRDELSKIKRIKINSPKDASPYILNISVDGIKGEDTKDALGKRGICVSVKSACSVKNVPSKAVYAVTGDKKRAASSFRVSLSHLTARSEAEEFIRAVREICGE